MVYEIISEVQRNDGTKVVYEYDEESLQLRATRTATENMPDGIKPGYIVRQVVKKCTSDRDWNILSRIREKLGLEAEVI